MKESVARPEQRALPPLAAGRWRGAAVLVAYQWWVMLWWGGGVGGVVGQAQVGVLAFTPSPSVFMLDSDCNSFFHFMQ